MLVCTMFTAVAGLIRLINISVLKESSKEAQKKEMDGIIETLISALKADTSPESDSMHDGFWKYNDTTINGYSISIESLSGKINLNFFPSDIIAKTNLKELFADPSGAASFMDSSEKLFYNYDEISDHLDEDNYNKYFTFHGWANYNLTDESRVKQLLESLEVSGSSSFLAKRKSRLTNRQYASTYADYRMILGTGYKSIMPYVNLEPPVNVNFVDEQILKDILSYPKFKVSGINQKAESIASLRESKEITREQLDNILGTKNSNELYYLLGVKTYFYKVEIKGAAQHCSIIIARNINDSQTDHKAGDWYLLEKKWI